MPARCAAVPCPRLAHRAEHDQPRARQGRIGHDGLGQLEAVHPGHLIVEDGQGIRAALRMRRPQAGERGGAIGDALDLHAPGAELRLEDGPVDRMVIDAQDAHAPQFRQGEQLRLVGRHPRAEPHREPEGAALPGCAVDTDRAPHGGGETLGDGQTQARAAVLARGRVVRLRKRLEQASLGVRRDANARVRDAMRSSVVSAVTSSSVVRTTTSPCEVNFTALPTRLVRIWRSRPGSPATRVATSGWITHASSSPLPAARLGQHFQHVLDRRAQVEVDHLQVHLARLDLREIEDVIDDGQQRLPGSPDGLGILLLDGGERCVQQQSRHADDAVHGRADLVTHRGQKVRLGAARRLRRVLGLLQGDLRLLALGDLALQLVIGGLQAGGALGHALLQPGDQASQLRRHAVEDARQQTQLVTPRHVHLLGQIARAHRLGGRRHVSGWAGRSGGRSGSPGRRR